VIYNANFKYGTHTINIIFPKFKGEKPVYQNSKVLPRRFSLFFVSYNSSYSVMISYQVFSTKVSIL
jgi:hypothetical protein